MFTLQVSYWSDMEDDSICTRSRSAAHKAAEAISLLSGISQVRICDGRTDNIVSVYDNGLERSPDDTYPSQQRRVYVRIEWIEPHDPWNVKP